VQQLEQMKQEQLRQQGQIEPRKGDNRAEGRGKPGS